MGIWVILAYGFIDQFGVVVFELKPLAGKFFLEYSEAVPCITIIVGGSSIWNSRGTRDTLSWSFHDDIFVIRVVIMTTWILIGIRPGLLYFS